MFYLTQFLCLCIPIIFLSLLHINKMSAHYIILRLKLILLKFSKYYFVSCLKSVSDKQSIFYSSKYTLSKFFCVCVDICKICFLLWTIKTLTKICLGIYFSSHSFSIDFYNPFQWASRFLPSFLFLRFWKYFYFLISFSPKEAYKC